MKSILLTAFAVIGIAIPVVRADTIPATLLGAYKTKVDVYGPTGERVAVMTERHVFKRLGRDGMKDKITSPYGPGQQTFRDSGAYSARYQAPFFVYGVPVTATYKATGTWTMSGGNLVYTATYVITTERGTYGGGTKNTLKRQGNKLVETYVGSGGYTGKIIYTK